ncbi:MAG: hypothetical protein IJN58_08295 [Clostridia bacterium]|nr:hypothetical protein [Clostridia bacterium]
MKSFDQMHFKRKWALSFFKNKHIRLGEMSLYKDFTRDTRGDPYPITGRSGDLRESVSGNRWRVERGSVRRLLGDYFPYATYCFRAESLGRGAGFTFESPITRGTILFRHGEKGVTAELGVDDRFDTGIPFTPGMAFLVTCRPGAFDLYLDSGDAPVYVGTLTRPSLANVEYEEIMAKSTVSAMAMEGAVLYDVTYFMDSGIAQADIRPIRTEDGKVLYETGKIWLSISVRMQEGCYQGILSWVPGTAEIELTGALFFNVGDGRVTNDVASSILYHRGEKRWYIWYCSFSHDHRLAHGIMDGDPRFGLNIVDTTLMEMGGKFEAFAGVTGDEDPDFFFDAASGWWYMTICRLRETDQGKKYRYVLFRSREPFAGYEYVTNSVEGEETGGSLIPWNGGIAFVCGSDFSKRAQYHVYALPDFENWQPLHPDFDDGGFRGWGTILPIPMGSRTRVFWLTFDRSLGSSYNWSYGNLYCFEATDVK